MGRKQPNPKPEGIVKPTPPPRPPRKLKDMSFIKVDLSKPEPKLECKCYPIPAKQKRKKKNRNTGIVIERELMPTGRVYIHGLKALSIRQLPPAYKKESKRFVALLKGENRSVITLFVCGETKPLLAVGKVYSLKYYEAAMKIISRCGEELHQWNAKTQKDKFRI
jgi:hypothetical protein